MEKIVEQTKYPLKGVLVKAFILIALIIVSVYLFQFTSVKDFLTPEALGHFLEASGFWAPLVFILIHASSICLFLPASILTIIGAAIFGAYWGFLYVWIGAIIGASGAFLIGRTLGRGFVAYLIGDRIKKYDDAIERNGFATVFYLRLMNFPFTPLNYGMSLTKVHFWDYFFGTGLGVVIGLFILTFLGGVLKQVWVSGNWGGLISAKFFFSIALLMFSFFIPMIIKKLKFNKWVKNG
jgi:uncharacterized membrane protein YdjX (TVP38/TMEM64 family)